MKHSWQSGLTLFNSGHFFDAHEVLEDVWREAPRRGHRRRHLQGLVQLAVAFHHQSTGNWIGACSVLKRALRNMEGAEDSFAEIDWKRFRGSLEPWPKYLGEACENSPALQPPPLPKIFLRDGQTKKVT
jgi:hypothetical protein